MGAVELALAYLETTLRNKRPRVLQGYMLSSKHLLKSVASRVEN